MEHLTAQIIQAAGIIKRGGVVAFPTETVYGLGANALDARAAARVFEAKRRPFFDPLIVHVYGRDDLANLVSEIPPLAEKLIDRFWPGPLTLVLPKRDIVPDIVTAGLPSAAVRSPSNVIARELIKAAGVPIAAPSANLFGTVSPTSAAHVREQLGGAVDVIVDGGECEIGVESTIISFMTDTPTLLRPGGTPLEEIEAVIGEVVIPPRNELVGQSPGRLEQHYATSAPLVQINDISDINDIGDINNISNINNISKYPPKKVGLLALTPLDKLGGDDHHPNIAAREYLSKNGDLREAAANLFAAMRRLDKHGLDIIAALPIPNTGLGLAINDRLRRASTRKNGAR